jgi:hypothetical protein
VRNDSFLALVAAAGIKAKLTKQEPVSAMERDATIKL